VPRKLGSPVKGEEGKASAEEGRSYLTHLKHEGTKNGMFQELKLRLGKREGGRGRLLRAKENLIHAILGAEKRISTKKKCPSVNRSAPSGEKKRGQGLGKV